MKNLLILLIVPFSLVLGAQNSVALIAKADSLVVGKNYKEAISMYTSALDAGSPKAETTFKIGNCYFFLGRDTVAQAKYGEAESLGYKNADLYFMRGQSKVYLKNNLGAIEDYSKAISINPLYYAAYKNRAYLYQQSAQYGKAVLDYDFLLVKDPSASLFYARAYNLQMNTMYDKAISDYKQAIILDSMNSNYYLNCGNCYILIRNYSEGVSYYTKAIQKDPTNSNAFLSRGFAYQTNGKNMLACEDLAQSRKLGNPNASQYMSNCGALPAVGTFQYYLKYVAELGAEDFEKKINYSNKALEIYKTKHDASDSLNLSALYLNRAAALVSKGDFESAEKDYKTVIQINTEPTNTFYAASAYYGLGDLFVAKKENKKAILNYDKAIEISKSTHTPEYYFNARALAKFYDGDKKGACEDYKSAGAAGMPLLAGSPLANLCK